MTDKTTKSKAELFKMLAEAVRNTQPQPTRIAEAAPTPDVQAEVERKTQPRKARLISKGVAKAKGVRGSAGRKKQVQKRKRRAGTSRSR